MSSTPVSITETSWRCDTAVDTFELGEKLGKELRGGEILLLKGPLGAGKTIFVKGLGAALGISPEEITSPSFTLVNLHEGRLRLFHIDLYRLSEGPTAAAAVDLEDLLADGSAVLVIEWAERLGIYPLPSNRWWIRVDGDGDQPRLISISRANQVKMVE